ncbi:MAG: glycoside hydrolase [Armatimonadota bacterium]
MKKLFPPAFACFTLLSLPIAGCPAQTVSLPPQAPVPSGTVTITVEPGARQTFRGFGASLGNWGGEYQSLSPANRALLSQSLWRDLRFNTLRLWFNTDKYAPTRGARDLAEFRRCYVDSGLIADAQKNGVTTLLLAPDAVPPYMAEKRTDNSGSAQTGMALKESETDNYAVLVADFIDQLKKQTGITITVTGVQNEPNNLERFTPSQIVRVTRRLRSELDRRGLQSVKIISPEAGNVDTIFYETVDALRADPIAWRGIVGIASHSYNNSTTPDIAERIAGTGKEYWQTEASDNGPEEPGDALRAATLASRFLNDMNHRVTHWIHFIGFDVADPRDNATRIFAFTRTPFQLIRYQKQAYYQQLSRTFDVGSVFRRSTSDLEGDMTYTYGKKPRVTVAAARNPDGTWGIGISNFTSPTFEDAEDPKNFEKHNSGYSARTFTVIVRIPEIATRETVAFTLHRSNSAVDNAPAGSAVMKNGVVTIPSVRPLDLITLRSKK